MKIKLGPAGIPVSLKGGNGGLLIIMGELQA